MKVYADTSFIVPLYKTESTSLEAAQLMGQFKPPVWISQLGELELHNAFELLVFRGELNPESAERKRRMFSDDISDGVFVVMPLPASAVFAKAGELADRYSARLGTRSLDLMHVAAALILEAGIFLSFDVRQREVAKAEGLEINS